MEQELKRKTNDRMSKTIEVLKKDFASIRTGRASLALLDDISVNYYNAATPLEQLASLSIPESRQIAIQPWDPKVIPDIEKAILKSDLGLTPINDGKIIRIPIPELTAERFFDDPFHPNGGRMYRTGDRARRISATSAST